MRTGVLVAVLAAVACACVTTVRAEAGDELGVLELRFTPTRFAQLAIWVERDDGEFLATVRLTEAVALRGIGNRPGASEMNGGFRWPYGRREGVLPIWASRRAAAPGAKLFRRVIYQDRLGEGFTSRTTDDFSPDDYFCLSFDRMKSTLDALDAVTCASPFTSDKGRYLTEADVAAGYAEPYEQPPANNAFMRPLSYFSQYPPRRDVMPCPAMVDCFHHPDVASFAAHAREVMPDIDAVTMATPVGGMAQQILFPMPASWAAGAYRACLEINVEGDYNATFNDKTLPSPLGPGKQGETWDAPLAGYGYPYRGQPSVLYCVPFAIGGGASQSFASSVATGSAGTWDLTDPSFGAVHPMDGLNDDPLRARGSGADRLLSGAADGARLEVLVKPALACRGDQLPSAVGALSVEPYPDRLHAHEWARLRFAPASDDRGVVRYEVRVSSTPIVDAASFLQATPAKQASVEAAELRVPTEAALGQPIAVDTGGLSEGSHYFLAVRALDGCANVGPLRVAEFTTPARVFSTVSPCFVATAAWGTPMASEIGALRRLRDRYLASHGPGQVVLAAYQTVGPRLADAIRGHERVRAVVRAALRPLVSAARWLDRAW